ncbi:MAG: hypothetical protein DDT35_00938 [Firmicutes bacterium]|nr:hypothetical protein [Bacillota bacterium]
MQCSPDEHVNVARPAPLAVTDESVSAGVAEKTARDFLRHLGANLLLLSQVEVVEAELPHFSFVFAHPVDANRHTTIEVVRNSGQVFQMFSEREPRAAIIEAGVAEQRAKLFLAERNLTRPGGPVLRVCCTTRNGAAPSLYQCNHRSGGKHCSTHRVPTVYDPSRYF